MDTESPVTRNSGFYWILVADEPEPAWWDGEGWAMIGGGEVSDPAVLHEDPIVFAPTRIHAALTQVGD